MAHTYLELRTTILDILSGREKTSYKPGRYREIELGMAEVLLKRDLEGMVDTVSKDNVRTYFSDKDRAVCRKVVWDLISQGILEPGKQDEGWDLVTFKVSDLGRSLFTAQKKYDYHDAQTYMDIINQNIPDIDPVVLIYLRESMESLLRGRVFPAAVLLGIATEQSFFKLLTTVDNNEYYYKKFNKVLERKLLKTTLLKKYKEY
jgi:hypothetical protein